MSWSAPKATRLLVGCVASVAIVVAFGVAPAAASANVFTFTQLGPPAPYLPPSSDAGKSLVSGDFNRDGHADIAFVNASGDNTGNCPFEGCVSVLLGNGDGTFSGPVNYPTGNCPYYGTASLAEGDLLGNGIEDLVVAGGNCITGGSLTILYGNGDGTFQSPVTIATGVGDRPDAVVVGDFNGDGRPDIAVTNGGDFPQDVSILLNQGGGNFTPASGSPFTLADNAAGSIDGMALANMTGHGNVDLVVSIGAVSGFLTGPCRSTSCVQVLTNKNDGSGNFNPAVAYPTDGGGQIAAADVRGTGKDDVLIPAYSSSGNIGTNGFEVLPNQGDGTLGAPSSIYTYPNSANPQALVVGDFNGDGIPDVAMADFDSSITVLFKGNGDGTFTYDDTISDPQSQQSTDDALLAASFRGTCKLDLALGSDAGVFIMRNDTPYSCPTPPPTTTTTPAPRPATPATITAPVPKKHSTKSGLKTLQVFGVPRVCPTTSVKLVIEVINRRPPQVTVAEFDGRRIARSDKRRFTVLIPLSRIRTGPNTLMITATDRTKHSLRVRRLVSGCAAAPAFTG